MGDRKDKKRQITLKPMCKYGVDCYQKNPDHHRKYTHPSPSKKDTLDVNIDEPKKSPRKRPSEDVSVSSTTLDAVDTPKRNTPRKSPNPKKYVAENVSGKMSANLDVPVDQVDLPSSSPGNQKRNSLQPAHADAGADIKEKFLVEMPSDFYDMWDFCMKMHEEDPSETFSELGLHLVGPYDILSKKISTEDIDGDNILCHYRYYYDPPEFMTVIAKDGDNGYHVGYFRDDPLEMPFGLASNCVADGAKLKLLGDNIFAAVNFELTEALKKCEKDLKKKFMKIREDLIEFSEKKRYSLERITVKTKKRDKKVVAKTFHNFGIVVPFNKARDIGYRPLTVTNAELRKILSKIANAETESQKLGERDELDEILTNVQFANDESDYGMGFELGIDLFCCGDPYLHKDILLVLQLAYTLLDRPVYSKTIKAHLSRRRKGNNVSIKDQ